MSAMWILVGYALKESLRRRVATVVLVLTLLFLLLYTVGAVAVFSELESGADADERDSIGTGLFGFAMFVILFLGVVLATFLTLGAVSGDAERGLLQPLAVRPLGRTRLLAARLLAAVGAAGGYTLSFYVCAMLITAAAGGWFPASPLGPGVALVAAVAVIATTSLLGSVFLSSTANGVGVFMLIGAGLTGLLLREIGRALDSSGLEGAAEVFGFLLPFVVLYLAGIEALGEEADIEEVGSFGPGTGAAGLALWTVTYIAVLWLVARRSFLRRDL